MIDAALFLDRIAQHLQGHTLSRDLTIADLRPSLVVEAGPHTRIAIVILDGSIGPRAMTLHLRTYFDHGMREVWLIDPADQTVELWNTPWQPLQLTDDDAISTQLLPGFSLPLPELFA
jgi:hypothetical protein